MGQSDGDDRRREQRFDVQAAAEVAVPSWEVFRLVYTINISKGGLKLILPRAPELSASLTVKFTLPGIDGQQQFEIPSIVRYVNPLKKNDPQGAAEVGVQFEPMSDQLRHTIESALQKNVRR
jgi:c-di-GMP-binding flagellar brake protein YcgR